MADFGAFVERPQSFHIPNTSAPNFSEMVNFSRSSPSERLDITFAIAFALSKKLGVVVGANKTASPVFWRFDGLKMNFT